MIIYSIGRTLFKGWYVWGCITLLLAFGLFSEANAAVNLTGNTACMASAVFQNSVTPIAMYCVKNAIGVAIEIYFEGIKFYVMPIVYAMITLSLVIYGIKLMSAQVQDVTKETMTILLKIGLIIYFITSWRDYYPTFFLAIDYLNGILNNVISSSSETCSPGLSGSFPAIDTFGNAAPNRNATVSAVIGTPASYALWFNLDCLMGRLFGSGDTAKYALNVSMVAVLGAAIFSGAFGFMLFLVGVTALLAVFFVIARSILTVMMAYISLAFAIILAPLFIPLFLFKQTTQYFLKWVHLIFNGIIQPVFIMGFLMFSLLLFNELLYEDSSIPASSGIVPLNKAMGVTKNSTVDQASAAMSGSFGRAKVATNFVAADNNFRKAAGSTAPRASSEKVANCKSNFLACTGIDLTAWADFATITFTNELEKFKAYIMNMLSMLFLAYVTLKLLYAMPEMATSITGNVAISLAKAAAIPLNLDTKLAGFIQKAQSVAMGGGGGAAGLLNKANVSGPNGQGWGAAIKSVGGNMAGNSIQLQGALGGKGGLIGGAVRGVIDGAKQGGVKGAAKGLVTGGIKGAASSVKDMVSSGASGIKAGAKQLSKDLNDDILGKGSKGK